VSRRSAGAVPEADLEALVTRALSEDVGGGDWTTRWTVGEGVRAEGVVVAKETMVVAGLDAARLSFRAVDPSLDVEALVEDGDRVACDTAVLRVRGSARSILTGERTALNFLGRLSGIATLTQRFVDEVEGTGARILDTRKTTPGWRSLEKWAVRMGGGSNHRMGLDDMIMIKDNHISAAGGLKEAVAAVGERNEFGLPVEVEVGDLDQLEEARGLGVDRILLDNMTEEELASAVSGVAVWPAPRPELEASGNVTLERVRSVAETGVDWISVGALTHSARSMDLSLYLSGLGGSDDCEADAGSEAA
jgi:nicotinate-nucleotide pyrophosphorylase (carboxylating)